MISDKKKFIFIHIPKAAGSTVRYTLRSYGNRPNWFARKSDMLFQKFFNVCLLRTNDLPGHATAAEVRSIVGEQFFDYYSFSFVRNPFDLEVSLYHYIKKNPEHHQHETVKKLSFLQFIELRHQDHTSQHKYVMDTDGKCIVDFVGRFESFDLDFASICKKLGLRAKVIHKNKSNHKYYAEYYCSASREIVTEIHKNDFEIFGYNQDVKIAEFLPMSLTR
jgi:hypothetical protein